MENCLRTMLWTSVLALSLAAGGCKKKQDDTGSAATEVKKTAEDVKDQAKDLDKTMTDKNAKPNDIDKANADLAAAKTDLAAAKDKYAITVKDRLAKNNIKMHELEARTDAKSKSALASLQARLTKQTTKNKNKQNHTTKKRDAFT